MPCRASGPLLHSFPQDFPDPTPHLQAALAEYNHGRRRPVGFEELGLADRQWVVDRALDLQHARFERAIRACVIEAPKPEGAKTSLLARAFRRLKAWAA